MQNIIVGHIIDLIRQRHYSATQLGSKGLRQYFNGIGCQQVGDPTCKKTAAPEVHYWAGGLT